MNISILPISQAIYAHFRRKKKFKPMKNARKYWDKYGWLHWKCALFTVILWVVILFVTAFAISILPSLSLSKFKIFLAIIIILNYFMNWSPGELKNDYKNGLNELEKKFYKKQGNKGYKYKIRRERLSLLIFAQYWLFYKINSLFSPFWLWSGSPYSDIWTFFRLIFAVVIFIIPTYSYHHLLTPIIIYLLIEMIAYSFRMIFSTEPSEKSKDFLQNASRSLFLFFINFISTIMLFANLYKYYIRELKVSLDALIYSYYTILPVDTPFRYYRINADFSVWESAIGIFMLVVIMVKFIRPLGSKE
jgi:hypothetical protein